MLYALLILAAAPLPGPAVPHPEPDPAAPASWAPPALRAGPQDETVDWPGGEGPLANDCFAPTSAEAQKLLARGDEAWARQRPLAEVFDSWHDALEAGAAGASVAPRPVAASALTESPCPDPDGTAARRTEGLERSVTRRLRAVGAEARAAWTARFEALADEALARAGRRPSALTEVERRHPCTPGAAKAALALADLELEQGRHALARTWLERALEHVELLEPENGAPGTDQSWCGLVRAAIEARRPVIATLARELDPDPEPARAAWESATSLTPVAFVPLVRNPFGLATSSAGSPANRSEPAPGLGVQPGLCVLASGLAVVQTAERLHVFDPEDGTPRGDLIPAMLFERANWIAGATAMRSTQPPGWPLLPVAHGDAVIAIQGRTVERSRNVLTCIEIAPRPAALGSSGRVPTDLSGARVGSLRWALRGDRLLDGNGLGSSGLALDQVEFQPGPVVLGSQLFVQVREPEAATTERGFSQMPTQEQVPSWIVAIDLASGRVQWKRYLAQGLALPRNDTRFGLSLAQPVSSAQPLATVAGRVFCGTHLGLGALVDPDGRLAWSFRNRRRAADAAGWSGWSPPVFATDSLAGLVWAPADSDFVYRLAASRAADAGSPLLGTPRAIGEAEVVLGGDAEQILVLARAGRERHASAWLADGGRHDAPFLGPGERFTGHGLVSERRAMFATQRGLMLLDRTRELFLLDYAPLADPAEVASARPGLDGLSATGGPGRGRGPEPGGSVQAFADRVAVVGPAGVWLFRTD